MRCFRFHRKASGSDNSYCVPESVFSAKTVLAATPSVATTFSLRGPMPVPLGAQTLRVKCGALCSPYGLHLGTPNGMVYTSTLTSFPNFMVINF